MKRVHATAARIPQAKSHISADASKVIPTQSPQERATDATFNTNEDADNDQNSGDVSALLDISGHWFHSFLTHVIIM